MSVTEIILGFLVNLLSSYIYEKIAHFLKKSAVFILISEGVYGLTINSLFIDSLHLRFFD